MLKPRLHSWLFVALLATGSVHTSVQARPGIVEEIIPQGNSRMTDQALLHALGIQVGDPFDAAVIRVRFKELWRLGLFEDIVIEAEDGPAGGKVLVVKVRERPVLSSVSYDDNRVITKTQIEDRLRERKIRLELGKPLDRGKIFFVESAIRDLLSEKGYLDARVSSDISRVTDTTRAVQFTISAGGKTRIRSITFTGNEVFSDRKLKSRLELTRERKWFWPWSAKNLYHPVKWDQDVAGLRRQYQDRGYLDVEIRAPALEVRRSKRSERKQARRDVEDAAAAAREKAAEGGPPLSARKREKAARKERKQAKKEEKRRGKRWVHLTVPLTEGAQYTLGEITFVGNEVFPDPLLRSMIPLAEGSVLSNGILEIGTERITRLYEDRGHLYSTVVRQLRRRENENVADVDVEIDEDSPYLIGRIDFQGNLSTQDRVLRREMLLNEGQLFNRTLLNLSAQRINRLGYWQVRGEPVIEPDVRDDRVAVTIAGEEQGRNEIQVGGGFSGLEGAFFNGIYSTRNFLGRGQVLSVALQVGGRSNRYQLSFQEPYFLGKPYLLGVNLFRRDTDFGNSLRSTSSGGGVQFGKQVGRASRIALAYNYQNVASDSFATNSDGQLVAFESSNKISSVTPVYSFSTINNPYRPSAGTSVNMTVEVAGGGLGGDTSYFKPLVNYTTYRRAVRRSYVALHAEAGFVRAFGDGSPPESSPIEGIPRFQRFWLGGEQLGPRVFESRDITPERFVKVENGVITEVTGDPTFQQADPFVSAFFPIEVGGDRMFLFQAEYVIPLNEQADIAFFVDAGDTLFEDTSFGFDTTRVAAGVELRFHLPIFPVPLRLIYGIPVRSLEDDRVSNFTFSIGRSF